MRAFKQAIGHACSASGTRVINSQKNPFTLDKLEIYGTLVELLETSGANLLSPPVKSSLKPCTARVSEFYLFFPIFYEFSKF